MNLKSRDIVVYTNNQLPTQFTIGQTYTIKEKNCVNGRNEYIIVNNNGFDTYWYDDNIVTHFNKLPKNCTSHLPEFL